MTGAKFLASATLLFGATFGLLEADEDHLLTILASVLFWTAHIGVGLVLAVWAQGLLAPFWQRPGLRWPPIVRLVAGGLLGSITFTPLAVLLEWVLAPLGIDGDAPDPSTPFAALVAGEWLALAPLYVLTWLALNLGYRSLREPKLPQMSVADLQPRAQPTIPAQAGFRDRLPPALGDQLRYLETDLNYLRVVTARGETLVLYSMSSAEKELGVLGLRIHRRYWVAHDAVSGIRRTGNGWRVLLADGTQLPVSRRRQRLVRETYGTDFSVH